MDIIKSIEHEQMKSRIPELKVGNTVKVHAKVKEGNRVTAVVKNDKITFSVKEA